MDFHEEQRAVWGDGDAFAQAVRYVQAVDDEMLAKVAHAVSNGVTPEALYDLCLSEYIHKENPRREQVLERMRQAETKVVGRLRDAMRFGTSPHHLPWVVVNTMLRGWAATEGQDIAPDSKQA